MARFPNSTRLICSIASLASLYKLLCAIWSWSWSRVWLSQSMWRMLCRTWFYHPRQDWLWGEKSRILEGPCVYTYVCLHIHLCMFWHSCNIVPAYCIAMRVCRLIDSLEKSEGNYQELKQLDTITMQWSRRRFQDKEKSGCLHSEKNYLVDS